jgi:hypothetical protein
MWQTRGGPARVAMEKMNREQMEIATRRITRLVANFGITLRLLAVNPHSGAKTGVEGRVLTRLFEEHLFFLE